MEGTKVCSNCGSEKPVSGFYKAGGSVINPCKDCRKQQRRRGLVGLKRINK